MQLSLSSQELLQLVICNQLSNSNIKQQQQNKFDIFDILDFLIKFHLSSKNPVISENIYGVGKCPGGIRY